MRHIHVSMNDAGPMPLTWNLLGFLASPSATHAPFHLGAWLATLEDRDLKLLLDYADSHCFRNTIDADFLAVGLNAARAEKQAHAFTLDPDGLTVLGSLLAHAAAMEFARRIGIVALARPIRLYPDPEDTITIDKAAAALMTQQVELAH